AALRVTRQLEPRDLPALAALTGMQVQSIGFLDGHRETWRRAVQLPARLSLDARTLLLTSGLTWKKMPLVDRDLLARQLSLPPGGAAPRYSARLKTSIGASPDQGGPVMG